MAVFLAFVAACFWGAADYLGGMQSKRFHFTNVTIVREATCVVMYLAIMPFLTASFHVTDVLLGLGVGVLTAIGLSTFFWLLANGRMSVVAPVAGTVGAVLPILFGIVSGERPSLFQLFGMLLAVLAIAFVSIEHTHDEQNRRSRTYAVKDISIAAVSGITFGLFYVAMHHTSEDSGFWAPAAVSFSMVVVLVLWNGAKQPVVFKELTPRMVGLCAIGGVGECVAAMLYIIATRHGFLSITAAVSSLYPVGTALLAGYFLKEKLTRVNLFGLALCAGGLAFIAK